MPFPPNFFLNAPSQQAISVEEVTRYPDLWVNQTITVKGYLAPVPMPNPTQYALYPQTETASGFNNGGMGELLFVQTSGTLQGVPNSLNVGILAAIRGTVRFKNWIAPNALPQGSVVLPSYYIEALNIQLLESTAHVP